MFNFNQQNPNVKIAIILGISLIFCVTIYSIVNATFRKTDTTRCVDAYLEDHKYASKLEAYKKCHYLLKR